MHRRKVLGARKKKGMRFELWWLLPLMACASLPEAVPHAFVAPAPSGTVEVCWLETGGTTVGGGLGSGGASRAPTWAVTSSALLVRHPKGDVLLDTGLSATAQDDGAELRGWARFVFDQTAGRNVRTRSLREQLSALGVERLWGVVLSHAHADHAGGVAELPGVPVWVGAPEVAVVEAALTSPEEVVVPAHARALWGRLRPIEFKAVPWATWDESWDVFGDGSVVVVPTFGHTPGSVATFLNVGGGLRLLHVGDLVNLHESIERAVGKSWVMRALTDVDGPATAAQVAKLVALHEVDPGLVVLPAHDRPRFVALFGEGAAVPPCRGGRGQRL
jgi:glyoxylase-like metal-dependent hydrolase (beta-lactamase superfamily II)